MLTEASALEDFDLKDNEAEIERMFVRNQYISRYYEHIKNGTLPPGFVEELCDCLAENWVDPYEWWENTERNIQLVIATPEFYVP